MHTQPSVIFVELFLPEPEALFHLISTQTVWDERMRARQTASFGAPYNYSNLAYASVPLPPYLEEICKRIEARLGFLPNNCLINRYVDGSSRMGFHSDSLTELVPGTGVAIVSLGETRTLTFRQTQQHDVVWSCPLPSGSLLYLTPEVQLEWQHGVLPQAGVGPRLSLTFRRLR